MYIKFISYRDLEADDISEGKGRYGVNPSELIRACNINFNIQEDAEEFFLNLLDKIDGSLESKDSPLPSHCFQSNLLQNTTCLHVEFTKSKMLKYLDFAIENSATVEEGIFKYFQKELLNGDSKIKAGDFGRQEAERTLFLQRPPRNMVLQLKRFGYDVEMDCMVKLHDRIEFPEELDLSIIDKNIENASLIYDLYGVVVHDGDPTQGHYTFFGRQLDKHGEWFYLNDQSVERCSWERVQEKGYGGTAYRSLRGVMGSCNSYLLFYKQRSATTPH